MKPPEKNIPDLKLERARLGPTAKSLIFLLGKEVKFEQIRVYSQSIQKKVFISMSYFVQAFSTVYPPTVYLVYALSNQAEKPEGTALLLVVTFDGSGLALFLFLA